MHDVVTMMVAINPSLLDYVYRRVDVDTIGTAKGESIADFRPQPEAKALKNWVKIGWSLHYKKFLEDFVKIMT